METRFVRPDETTLAALVDAVLPVLEVSPDRVEWVEHGSNTVVALAGDVAVRISRQPGASAELLRAQALVDALPDLPFAVPRSLADATEVAGHVAIPVQRIPGTTVPPAPLAPEVLHELLDAIHAVPPGPLAEHLAEPRAFCGGQRWEQVLRERVLPLLAAELRQEAVERVEALAQVGTPGRVLNHGDLGGGNIHWEGGRVVGVLDWDLAAADDPAEDVATVAGSFGIWDSLTGVLDDDTIRRAHVFRRSFPLQVVGFAVQQERPAPEIARVIGRAERALRADLARIER